MTAQLPPNLLALFAPRPPLRYMPPADHAPEDRRTAQISGVAQYLPQLKEQFGDYEPTESWLQKKDREMLEKEAHQKYYMSEGFAKDFNPKEDKAIRGDPYRTLFVSRLDYKTDTKDIEREFGRFGPIERVRIVVGTGEADKKHKNKPRGYAFIVFEKERDMKAAYKETENLRIRNRRVVVDVERGRTVNGWRPRRYGGGLGGRGYNSVAPAKPSFGPPLGPGGGFRGGFDRGGFRGGGFRGGRGGGGFGDRDGYGGGRGGGGFRGGYSGGGGRGGIGYNDRGFNDAPAGPRGGYGGRDDRGSRTNANLEPLPPRGGYSGGGGGYRDRDNSNGNGGMNGSYAGQKRSYEGGGYDDSRSRRPRY